MGFSTADALLQSVCLCSALQEIRCGCSRWDDSLGVRHRPEELRFSRVGVLEDHDGGDVAAAVAVVGRRPHGDQLLVKHELVALVDELVRPADQLQVVDVDKLICDLCTKEPAGSSRADGPRVHVFGIRPHQITKCSFVRDFLVPLDGSNLVQSLDVWGETSVDTQDLFIQQSGNCQHIKHLCAIAPGICVSILGLTLIIKSINLGNLSALVVPSQECNTVRPLGFQYQQVGEGLQTVVASVHKVPHENVVCVWDLATSPEQFTQIIKLSMDISTYCHGS